MLKEKTKIKKISQWVLFSFVSVGSVFQLIAQEGEVIFKQNCGVCHRVGGGRSVGPDLIGVTNKRSEEWLMKWTKSSQALVKSGDADAKAIFDEFGGMVMPDQNLSDADIKSIYAFIASKSPSANQAGVADTTPAVAVADASNEATPEQIELGKSFFIGSQSFSAGGVSCISCHNVNYKGIIPGGMLAKDLTTAHSRMGGDAGLQAVLGAPPFPAMTQAYKNNPLSEQEIFALTAFLNKVDKDKENQQASKFNPLLYGGFVGLFAVLAFIYIVWNQRKKDTVKKDIFNRQIKTH